MVMSEREIRGLEIAALSKLKRNGRGWIVPSQTNNRESYTVIPDEQQCTCPDHQTRQVKCKHIFAVEYTIRRETLAVRKNGVTKTTETVKATYSQEWTAYNAAQTHEQERFILLLRELCNGIPQPIQTFGRPRLPLSDVVFGAAYKAYTTMSGRRMMTELREAKNKGLLDKTPSFTSAFRYLENPELTFILKSLIEQSALPLRAVETDFAVDSTGFATSTYARWYDHKWGKERMRQTWVKTHIMVGVKTHVVTSVEATPTESNDGAQFPALVERTAQNFAVNEVSADKAYSTKRNLRIVQAIGGTTYVPFKSNATGLTTHHKSDDLWNRMWHYYQFNRSAFMECYHKRSNVETAFSMIKAKFGGSVRAKTPVAQVNEVLCKVLCHNICVLIQSWYELGIEATFGTEFGVVPKVPVG